MPGSEHESVNSSSNATDGEEVVLFECKICKQHCTAAEKDSHRAMHNRKKRKIVPSPDRSEAATLFEQVLAVASPSQSPNIPVSAEREGRARASRSVPKELTKKKAEKREKSGKRRSKKNYNKDQEWVKSPGS